MICRRVIYPRTRWYYGHYKVKAKADLIKHVESALYTCDSILYIFRLKPSYIDEEEEESGGGL